MKSNLIKNFAAIILVAAFITAISSCNRGLGCPNNFSIDTPVEVLE